MSGPWIKANTYMECQVHESRQIGSGQTRDGKKYHIRDLWCKQEIWIVSLIFQTKVQSGRSETRKNPLDSDDVRTFERCLCSCDVTHSLPLHLLPLLQKFTLHKAAPTLDWPDFWNEKTGKGGSAPESNGEISEDTSHSGKWDGKAHGGPWGRGQCQAQEGCRETCVPQQQRASPVAQTVKNLPAMQETWVQSLGQEDPLEEGMATHSRIVAWRIPWTEEPGRLQSMGLQRVRWRTPYFHFFFQHQNHNIDLVRQRSGHS